MRVGHKIESTSKYLIGLRGVLCRSALGVLFLLLFLNTGTVPLELHLLPVLQ